MQQRLITLARRRDIFWVSTSSRRPRTLLAGLPAWTDCRQAPQYLCATALLGKGRDWHERRRTGCPPRVAGVHGPAGPGSLGRV